MAEGAGALVLESLEAAQSRGAKILGVIAGCGELADTFPSYPSQARRDSDRRLPPRHRRSRKPARPGLVWHSRRPPPSRLDGWRGSSMQVRRSRPIAEIAVRA